MPDPAQLALYVAAAFLLAVTPGPGIFYVAARTLAGGRSEGIASSFGTGLGGMVHVLAGSLGVSALVLASAELFTALKLIGAAYLVWLGFRTVRAARREAGSVLAGGTIAPPIGASRAFREGVVVEGRNPKTAAFFLAFIPQFVDPGAGQVALQFVVLGFVSVGLNTLADIVVALAAARVRTGASPADGDRHIMRPGPQGSGRPGPQHRLLLRLFCGEIRKLRWLVPTLLFLWRWWEHTACSRRPPRNAAVPIKKSLTDDYIVCLEDGKKLKMLKRHLMTAYGMTPEEYRARWGLKADYPMVAPNYAKKRQELAKKIGLSRKPRVVRGGSVFLDGIQAVAE